MNLVYLFTGGSIVDYLLRQKNTGRSIVNYLLRQKNVAATQFFMVGLLFLFPSDFSAKNLFVGILCQEG